MTFTRPETKQQYSLYFWNSLNDKEHGKEPTAYGVLAAITKNDPGTFENFCGDFGYDEDSRKAEKIYQAVQKEWWRVEEFFRPEEFEALYEIA